MFFKQIMNKPKVILWCFWVALFSYSILFNGKSIFAQRVTNIGIVDLVQVSTIYFRESTAVRDLEGFKERIEDEKRRLESQILSLEDDKIDAESQNLKAQALRIDSKVFELKQYLRDYITVKNRQYNQMGNRLANSDEFLNELALAIEFVPENEGLSLILNRNNSSFLYYVPEIDVTDKVIEELSRMGNR